MSTPSSFRRSPRLSNCHGTPASGTRSATKGKLPSTPFSCISAGSVAKKKRHTPVATPSSRKRTSTPENTLVNNGHDPSPSGQEGRECVQTAGNDDNFDAHGSAAAPDAAAASALSLSSIKPEPVRSSERRSASRRMDATTSGGSRTRFGTYYSTTRNERDLWLLGLCQSSGKKRKENVESLESNDCKDKNTPIDGRKSAEELVDTAKNIANNDDGDSDSARNEDVSASSSSRNASNSAGTTNPPPETTNDRKTTPATPLPDVVQSSETILMATKPRYSPFSPANNDGKRSFSQTISFLPPPEDKVYKINDSERKLSRANDKVHKSTKFEKKWDEVEVAPTVDELRNIIEKAKYSVNTSSSLASIKTNNLAPSETAGSHETWPTTNSSAPNKCSVEAYSPTLTNGLSMTPESKRHPIRKYAPRDNVVFKSSRLEKKWDEVEVAPSVEELRDRIRKAKCHSVTTSSPSSSINTKNDLETLNAPNSRATIPTTSFLSSPPGATNDLAPTDTYAAMNAASMTPDSKPKKHGKSISPRSRGSTAPKSVLASPAKSLDFTTSPQKSRPATSCNEVKPSPKRQKSTRVKSQIIRNNPRFAMSLESYGTAIANSLSSPARTDILSPNHSEKQQPFISPGKRSSAESALHFLAKKTRSAENSENIRGGLQLDDRSKHFDKSVDKRGPLASYSQNAKGDAISKVEDETNLKQSTLSSNESDVSLEKMIRNYVPANRNDEKWLRNFQKWRSLRHADAMDKSKITVSGKTSPLPKGWVRTQRTYYRLLKESNQLGMSDARITLLEKAGFSWGGLHSKISMFEKDPEHSDEEKIHDDDNEDDVSITKKNVKKKTKQPDGSNEENDVFRLLKPGQTNSLPKQLSKKHVDIDPERRTSSAEDGEPGTKRKSPRLSCPTEFFHNTVMSNTTISSKRKTSNRDRKKLDSGKKAAHLPWKPEDSELGKAVDFECRRSKCEQPRVSNRVSSTKLSESLSSTSNVKSDIKGKPSEISVSNTEEKFDKSTKSIVIENQCLNWKKKKRRGGRHSVSSFFDLNDRKNDPERSKSGAKQSVLSHKMLEEQLKKTMKLQRKRSEKKKLDEKSIAETTTSKPSLRKTNNHKSDTAPSTLRQGDNECLKKVNDESNESKISIDSKDDTSLQINRATSPSSPESPLRAIKLLSTPPEAKPQTSSRSYKIKTKDPQEQAVKSVSECDRALISKEDSSTVPDGENVSTHNPLKASEEDELRNDTIMTAQLLTESREETLSLTEELNPSLQEEGNHMKGTPQTAAKMKTLAGTPEFATFSPLSLNSPLGRTHLLEKSFEDGTPESLKNAYASNTITENPVVKENAHSVGIESTVNTQENLVWSISNRDIAASSTDQVTPWLNDSVGNISGIPSTPHNVETRQELILAQQQYQEKMAEFGRLELEAKMIEERMREIESKIKDLDGTSARSMDRSLFSMEIPECPPLEWTYNDKTGFAPARNYDVASRYDDKQYFSTREKIRMKSTNKIRYDSSRRSERSRRKRQSYEFRDYSVDRRDFSENGRRQNRLTRERSKRDGGMQRREHRGNYAGPENKIVGTSARKRLKECATRKKRSSDLCSDELNGNFSKPISRSKKRSKIDDQSMGSISEAKNFRATTRIKMNSEVNDGVPCELVRDSKKPLSVIRSEKIGDTFLDRQVGFTRDAKKSTSVPRPKKRAKIQTQSQLQIHTENVNTGVDCSTPRQKDSPKATSNLTNKSSSTRKGETRDTLSDSSNVIGTRKPSLSIQKTSLSSHSFGDVKCTELIVEGNDAADTAEMAKNTTEGNHMIEKEQNSAKERHPNCNDKCEVENERRDPLYWLAGGEQSSDDESWDFDGPMILPPPPL